MSYACVVWVSCVSHAMADQGCFAALVAACDVVQGWLCSLSVCLWLETPKYARLWGPSLTRCFRRVPRVKLPTDQGDARCRCRSCEADLCALQIQRSKWLRGWVVGSGALR
ncbi:hypothetical protein Micbo1qcDRAFT_26525 [Microdochium bolleyi]|uniref:Secreted protein n=1 Tax=Microdochium bolleyi TaxID=196109 RepID=A0A136JE75_9PEZI|nr:hypothetical protein Micbo1qcDRAFT_26525 [Microdochium bolleyi]